MGTATVWRGDIPGEGVVYLKVFDGNRRSLLTPSRLGDYVRSEYWFSDRAAPAYADFDPRTSIARLGMGDRELGVAKLGP